MLDMQAKHASEGKYMYTIALSASMYCCCRAYVLVTLHASFLICLVLNPFLHLKHLFLALLWVMRTVFPLLSWIKLKPFREWVIASAIFQLTMLFSFFDLPLQSQSSCISCVRLRVFLLLLLWSMTQFSCLFWVM